MFNISGKHILKTHWNAITQTLELLKWKLLTAPNVGSMWSNWKFYMLPVEMWNGSMTLVKVLAFSLKVKHTRRSSNSISTYLPKKNENICPQGLVQELIYDHNNLDFLTLVYLFDEWGMLRHLNIHLVVNTHLLNTSSCRGPRVSYLDLNKQFWRSFGI